jgi:4-hydroxy-2-oxoheptanedioate aldolase
MRSFGPIRARLGKPNYLAEANGRTITCAQIETQQAIDALDGILAVPGLDMICAGPNDLAMSLRGDTNFRSPEVEAALDTLLAKCRVHNVIATIFANDEDYAKAMIAKGWQAVAIGTDAAWIAAAARGVRRAIDGTGQSGLAAPVPGVGGPNEAV